MHRRRPLAAPQVIPVLLPGSDAVHDRGPARLRCHRRAAGRGADAKTTPGARRSGKLANGNILRFFKKVEVEEQLFCGASSDSPGLASEDTAPTKRDSNSDNEDADVNGAETPPEDPRYNENGTSSKRRKLSHDGDRFPIQAVKAELPVATEAQGATEPRRPPASG